MADNPEEQLRVAAGNGDVDKVKSLLDAGTKQTANEEGQTPLFIACTHYYTEPKYVEAVRALLESDTSTINVKTKEGDAPIHSAAANGHFEITEMLLEYGADLDLEGQNGMVPLAIAAMKKHHALATMFIAKLREDQKFTKKQVEWMFSAKQEQQQLHIFRAITSILQIKGAMDLLLKLDLITAITKGLTLHNKKSLQTLGLQIIKQIVVTKEGHEAAKKQDLGKFIEEITQSNDSDPVVKHLGKEILDKLK